MRLGSNFRLLPLALALLGLTTLPLVDAAAAPFSFLQTWGARGTAPGALHGPDNVAVDLRGDVYVADRDNNRIEEFTAQGAFVRTFGRNGGDGTAGLGNGEFRTPRGVTTDGRGDIYVADSGNNRIQKFGPDGRFLARFGRHGGDGTAGRARGEFNDPRGLATDLAGNLWVADHGNNRIEKLAPDGRFLQVIGRHGGEGSAGLAPAEFRNPRGLAVDRAGNVFVADKNNNRIQKFDPNGAFIRMWGRNGGDGTAGKGNGEFNRPYSVAVDPAGIVYVADRFNNRVQSFSSQGVFLGRFGRNGGDGTAGSGAGEFRGPYGVATDCRGSLYVTDEGNNRVERFGDPSSLPPVCPPTIRLGRVPNRIPGRTLVVSVRCDQPCTVTLHGTISSRRRALATFAARSRRLEAGRAARIRLLLSRRAARALHALLHTGGHPVVSLHVEAVAFSGTATPLDRARRLTL